MCACIMNFNLFVTLLKLTDVQFIAKNIVHFVIASVKRLAAVQICSDSVVSCTAHPWWLCIRKQFYHFWSLFMATTTSCRTGCCYSVGDTLSASFKIKIITVTGCYQSSVFIQGSPQIDFWLWFLLYNQKWCQSLICSYFELKWKVCGTSQEKIRKIVLNLEPVTINLCCEKSIFTAEVSCATNALHCWRNWPSQDIVNPAGRGDQNKTIETHTYG